jgi:flotillin
MEVLTLIGAIVAVPVVLAAIVAVLVKLTWRVAEPNEALVISGAGARGGKALDTGLGFKIVVGKGTLALPGLQTVRRLGLELHKADLVVDCVTTQGIPVHVRGVVVYKVGDGTAEIANAARRFLEKEEEMDSNVHEVFAGHLRQIVGAMTVEDMIRAREKLAAETRSSSAVEMEKLGLVIDSLQIQQVEDPTGYIENLAKPYQAAVEADARIAAAERNREATEREQAAAAVAAKAISDSEIEQARLRAAANTATAQADQAGPLAEAASRKDVVVQETEVAELEAARTEKRLQTEVVKPAQADRDARIAKAEAEKREVELAAAAHAEKVKIEAAAEAQRVKLQAEADAEQTRVNADADAVATERTGAAQAKATKLKGDADASAVKAKGLAEADAIDARAQALERNQDAVISQQVAEQLPEIVRAAAESFRGIDNLTVLNGADGMNDMVTKVMGMGASAIPMFRSMLSDNSNGNAPAESTTES